MTMLASSLLRYTEPGRALSCALPRGLRRSFLRLDQTFRLLLLYLRYNRMGNMRSLQDSRYMGADIVT